MPTLGGRSAAADGPVALCNLANTLTAARLVLVPVFLFALLVEQGQDPAWRIAAAVLFAAAAVTDRFDGDVARRRGQVTDFGKIADPIADKALTGAALFALSAIGELAWWVTVVIAAREVGVTLLRMWVLHDRVVPATRGGKVKTGAQAVAIGLYVLPLGGPWDPVRWAVMGVAVLLTVATGVDYAVRAMRPRPGVDPATAAP